MWQYKRTLYFLSIGLQIPQSVHSNTGSLAEHSGGPVADDVGVQEQGDGDAVPLH